MRRACLAALMPLLVAGCQSEPSFDERYGSAERAIRDKAKGIDAELATGGPAADAAASGPTAAR